MKTKRHNAIIDFIKTREIATQEELLDLLKKSGFDVTQATISRDIRELNLTKVNVGNRQKYAVIQNDEGVSEKYVRVLRDGFVSMLPSGNLVVLEINEIGGCIAGDDTIFIAVSESSTTTDVINELKKLTKED